jgi:broad specificity phosphatase PhoE
MAELKPPTTLLLVRHGQTDWNVSGQIMGQRPVPLNETGERQAHRLAELLRSRPIRAIYTSPVVRAQRTAEIVGSVLQVPVTAEPGLCEIGCGEWEGRYWKDLADDLVRHDFYAKPAEARPPGGETLLEVQARAVQAVERVTASAGSGQLVLVSHADVVRAILAHYLELDLQMVRRIRIDHASLTAVELNGTVADLLFLNYTVWELSE